MPAAVNCGSGRTAGLVNKASVTQSVYLTVHTLLRHTCIYSHHAVSMRADPSRVALLAVQAADGGLGRQ